MSESTPLGCVHALFIKSSTLIEIKRTLVLMRLSPKFKMSFPEVFIARVVNTFAHFAVQQGISDYFT